MIKLACGIIFIMNLLSVVTFAQCPSSPQLYSPIRNVNVVVTNGHGKISTVSVSATGGSTPFVYSIVKSESINYPDEQSVYTDSANKQMATAGTYQIRVKDACNKFYTKTVIIGSSAANRETGSLCPTSIVAAVTTTDADCPSNGSATINVVNPGLITCMLLTGPPGATINVPQSDKVFNALLPGNYTVTAFCASYADTVSFTIHDNYVPISNVTAAITGTCGSYSPGGNVSISVTGGSAPFVYSIIKSNDPNYSDALSIYNSSSSKTVNSFGTYQVRVKDACNQFYTVTKQVSPPLGPVIISCSPAALTSCGPAYYNFYCQLLDAITHAEIDSVPYNAMGGVKLRVFEQAAGSCAPTGPLLLELTPPPTHGQITVPVVSSNKYFCQVITPCGDTLTNCIDATNFYTPLFSMTTSVQGCGSTGDPLLESVAPDNWYGLVFPLTVNLYRGTSTAGVLTGTKVSNTDGDMYTGALTFTNLIPDQYYMTATDACGHSFTQLLSDPTGAGTPSLAVLYSMTAGCAAGAGITTQSGTGSYAIGVQGFLPNAGTATLTIISGPSNIGVTAFRRGDVFIWINLLPGTYTAALTTTCGTINLTFTIPNNPSDVLSQHISVTSSSTCGAGSGIITATTDYNGGVTPVFILANALTNASLDSNTTGLFTSVMPGQYYVNMKLFSTTSSCIVPPYYINGNTVTIAPAGGGPQIVKKMGVACEDIHGTPLSTGSVYLSIAGVSPFLIEYKLTSSSTWVTYTNSGTTESEIPGLTNGGIYDIRVTSCGITTATQVTIGQAGPVSNTNNIQPCVGIPYELALPQLPGAVYEWKNAAGTVLSTAYNYTITSYNMSFDGQYTGKLTWNGCLSRADTVVLNSMLCGSFIVLPVTLSAFTAKAQNCTVIIDWETSAAQSFEIFYIERSTNGRDYIKIGNTLPGAGEKYNYIDNSPVQGTLYYRLKMIAADGHYQYSDAILVNTRCNSINTLWSVFPALVTPGSSLTVKLNTSNTATQAISIVITSITGQRVHAYDEQMHQGQNMYTLRNNNLVPGTYLLCVYDKNLLRIGAVHKLIFTR